MSAETRVQIIIDGIRAGRSELLIGGKEVSCLVEAIFFLRLWSACLVGLSLYELLWTEKVGNFLTKKYNELLT